MLVTLTSSSSGEIIMFSDIAHRLFDIAGKACTARGVFTKEQLPAAIEKLRQALAAEKANIRANDPQGEKEEIGDEENPNYPGVSLTQRAYPLINLMELTRKEDGFLMWQATNDF